MKSLQVESERTAAGEKMGKMTANDSEINLHQSLLLNRRKQCPGDDGLLSTASLISTEPFSQFLCLKGIPSLQLLLT